MYIPLCKPCKLEWQDMSRQVAEAFFTAISPPSKSKNRIFYNISMILLYQLHGISYLCFKSGLVYNIEIVK